MKFLSAILKKQLYSAYLREYIKLSGLKDENIRAWILPVAAARLKDGILGQEKWLLSIVDKEIKRLCL